MFRPRLLLSLLLIRLAVAPLAAAAAMSPGTTSWSIGQAEAKSHAERLRMPPDDGRWNVPAGAANDNQDQAGLDGEDDLRDEFRKQALARPSVVLVAARLGIPVRPRLDIDWDSPGSRRGPPPRMPPSG